MNAQGTKLKMPLATYFPSLEAVGVTIFLCLVPEQFYICAHIRTMCVFSLHPCIQMEAHHTVPGLFLPSSLLEMIPHQLTWLCFSAFTFYY